MVLQVFTLGDAIEKLVVGWPVVGRLCHILILQFRLCVRCGFSVLINVFGDPKLHVVGIYVGVHHQVHVCVKELPEIGISDVVHCTPSFRDKPEIYDGNCTFPVAPGELTIPIPKLEFRRVKFSNMKN